MHLTFDSFVGIDDRLFNLARPLASCRALLVGQAPDSVQAQSKSVFIAPALFSTFLRLNLDWGRTWSRPNVGLGLDGPDPVWESCFWPVISRDGRAPNNFLPPIPISIRGLPPSSNLHSSNPPSPFEFDPWNQLLSSRSSLPSIRALDWCLVVGDRVIKILGISTRFKILEAFSAKLGRGCRTPRVCGDSPLSNPLFHAFRHYFWDYEIQSRVCVFICYTTILHGIFDL
jgi:hypothetical protein